MHQSIGRLWQNLTGPAASIGPVDRRRQARLLSSLLLALLLLALLALFEEVYTSPGGQLYLNLPFFLAVAPCAIFGGLYFLSRTRHTTAAAAMTIGFITLITFATAIPDPDPNNIFLLDYLIVPVFLSSILLPLRATILGTSVQLVGMLVFGLWISRFGVALETVIVGPMSFILIVSSLILVLARHRDHLEQDRQAQLDANEKRFRALIEHSSDGITLINERGAVLYQSPANARILGYQQSEDASGNFFDLVHPDDVSVARAALDALLAHSGTTITTEYRYRHRDDSWRWLEVSGTNLLHEPGVEAVVTNFRDITERKQSDERMRLHLARIAALRDIDRSINANSDLGVTLHLILERAIDQLHVDAADVLLLDSGSGTLNLRAAYGPAVRAKPMQLGEGYAGIAALERRTVVVPNLEEPDVAAGHDPSLAGLEYKAYAGAPLVAQGEVRGMLEVFQRAPLAPDRDWLDFLEALAGQATIAIETTHLFDGLQRSNVELSLAYDTTLEGWSRALDLRDKETEGHTQRVTQLTMRLAQAMGLGPQELLQIRRGSLLHDIGKMGVPDAILLKPGPLTDDEWTIMRKHPVYAYELLSPIEYLKPALDIPHCHHEKWDGTGYPRGLKGEQIPLAARLFAVIDIWDALRSDRPYRAAWPVDVVRNHIRALSGTHFDPRVIDAFLDMAL